MANASDARILKVGIIGCGEISQVAHIPNFNFLSDKFQTTYLCDISKQALAHCTRLVQGGTPKTTTNPEELCASPDVDVVLIANADAYHVEHGIMALKNDKYVLIEKPASTCFRDIDRLIEAENASKGKVFVGTMRRYATVFVDAVKEVGGMEKITYARVRDIIGPNSIFVQQNGMFPKSFNDFTKEDGEDRTRREQDIYKQALVKEFGVPNTPKSQLMLRVLGGLGTHDLSAMREILGMPRSVAGAVLTLPGIFSVLFQYDDFPVMYESGLIGVPQFDAHIEVYSLNKVVRVNFDSPYVKGLPVIMTVREKLGEDGFQERTVRKTYQDPYTLEMLEFYDCAVEGKTPKTSAADARKDVELFQMILRAGADRFKLESNA
ncbi:Inositol 2-dehydrogenase 3 [Fusarium austroafricanum]|uniref:Inositol 2-dehydrogenase 3 n=1 Tax=Fusarium austroafricanum TaxID=2364996 RepID=A0A8H4K2Y2_9HYPO|nr:Inositol 2-dehydrogenase 3 [Fusarium austroafricanum]